MNILSALLAAVVALGCGAVRAADARADPVPVMIGGEKELDACGATAVVSGLRRMEGNLLAVRRGPGLRYQQIDALAPGARVWLCDRKGRWAGVVYSPTDKDCGVATPSPARKPYSGSCLSGWVHEKYLTLEAG